MLKAAVNGALWRTGTGLSLKSVGIAYRGNDFKEKPELKKVVIQRELDVLKTIAVTSLLIEGVFGAALYALKRPVMFGSNLTKLAPVLQNRWVQFVPQLLATFYAEARSREKTDFDDVMEDAFSPSSKLKMPTTVYTAPQSRPFRPTFPPQYANANARQSQVTRRFY